MRFFPAGINTSALNYLIYCEHSFENSSRNDDLSPIYRGKEGVTQKCPKNGLTRRAKALLGYNCVFRLSHTTSMLTPHSLFRSKIFFCNMSTNLMRLYYCLNCINYYLLYIYILLCQELLKAGSFQGDFIIITQKAKKGVGRLY